MNREATRSHRSPASRQARLVVDLLEDVLLDVRGLPGRVAREPIVEAVEGALAATTALADSPLTAPDHLDKLEAAQAAVRAARERADGVGGARGERLAKRLFGGQRALEHCREATIDAVVEVQQDVARRPRVEAVAAGPFVASRGIGRLHAIERDVLRTGIDATPPAHWIFDEVDEGPREAQLGEGPGGLERETDDVLDVDTVGAYAPDPDDARRLQMLVPRGVDAVMTPGLEGEIAQLERIARDCLEDLGINGNLRQIRGRERFDADAVGRFEQRMLSALDAVIGLGTSFELSTSSDARYPGHDVLSYAIRWARDSAVPDPTRGFALALLLGSVEGADTLRAAVLTIKQSHPSTYPLTGAALSIAPHPGIDEAMRKLTADDDPRLAAMALDVLAARRSAEPGPLVVLLQHGSPRVREAAARCLGRCANGAEAAALVQVLGEAAEDEIEDAVVTAEIEAMIALGGKKGLRMAKDRLLEDAEEEGLLHPAARDRLLELVAMAGNAEDGELLTTFFHGRPSESVALGRHGHLAAVPALIEALAGGADAMLGMDGRREAARALRRILGAADIARPSDESGPADDVTTYAPVWQDWWAQHRADFDPELRYRDGVPFSALSLLDELTRDGVTALDRERTAFELALVHPPGVGLHETLFRQREQLEALAEQARADLESKTPRLAGGAWGGRLLR